MKAPPLDRYERRIDYLRISVTDRCNLRCVYCMPEGGVPRLNHKDVLRYEEILRLARIAIGAGITKIRITGGEPLVRQGILELCKSIAQLPELQSLSITTNGVLLSQFATPLFEAGIKRINISLDTLRPDKYAAITRRDNFRDVWRGIQVAEQVGFDPIKLNVVAMYGVNDEEIEDLAHLTYKRRFHVRFIEFMPFQPNENGRRFLSSDEVLSRLSRVNPLLPVESRNSNGPARHFRFPDAKGKIGIISPLSHHFCPTCNRLRLTADGKLRTCLFAGEETDLRALLRHGASDEEIISTIREAIMRKPEGHELTGAVSRKCTGRPMSAIGG